MSPRYQRWYRDCLLVSVLVLVSVALAGFLLRGQYLDTTYADWMYHAFRAWSLQHYGLLSWDSIWNDGIAYWRGYQMVPAALTVLTSNVFHLTITKAMIVLTVVLYAMFHAGIYLTVRRFGQGWEAALGAALASYLFPAYWLIMKDYSISFAAAFLPFLLILWHWAGLRPDRRLVMAAAIGLAAYVHPLLAVSLGCLWLVQIVLNRRHLRLGWLAAEAAAMALPAAFYVYGLTAIDSGYAAPYQLEKNFILIVGGSFILGVLYWLLPALGLVAVFRRQWLSPAGRTVIWSVLLLAGLALLNLRTPFADVLNRFQLSRTVFFMATGLVIVFGESFGQLSHRLRPALVHTLLAVMAGLALAQSLADTSTYAAVPVASVPDAVDDFMKHSPPAPVTGTVYINNSIVSSYHQPGLRYVNGYNDQLLPQLATDRLYQWLQETNPTLAVPAEQAQRVDQYLQALNVQYVFLAPDSPYVSPLTTAGFTRAADLSGTGHRLVVLQAPYRPQVGVALPDGLDTATITRALPRSIGSASYYDQLDSALAQVAGYFDLASSQTTPGVSVAFPRPDQLKLSLPNSDKPQNYYIAQSYSRWWTAPAGVKIQRSTAGFMVITVPPHTATVELRHTWGPAAAIETGALTLAGLIVLAGALIARRRPSGGQHA